VVVATVLEKQSEKEGRREGEREREREKRHPIPSFLYISFLPSSGLPLVPASRDLHRIAAKESTRRRQNTHTHTEET
jgi:hypothetical protein